MNTSKFQPNAGTYRPSTPASKLPSSYGDLAQTRANLVPGASKGRQPHDQDEADDND